MPTISKVITKDVGARPVLVDFQNGKIKPGEESNLETAIYETRESKPIVSVTNGNMLYTGIIETENDLYNNFILVHNKRKNKIRLIQVDCCTVSPLLNKRNNLIEIPMNTYDTSLSELNKQFGSKKTKRSTEQMERLKMNIDTIKDQLEKTVADVAMDEADLTSATPTENDSLYLPKINRDASVREQIYNLEDLIPKHVFDALGEEANNIVNEESIDEYSLTPYAYTNISRMLASDVVQVDSSKIAIFIYINYLIKFMSTTVKDISKKQFVICDNSIEINNHILDNYSMISGRHRTRPLSMKDKAVCFALVLAALASNYEVDIEQLSKDFKMGYKKIFEISRILGFSTTTKNKNLIILKLPLPAPVNSNMKRKRK